MPANDPGLKLEIKGLKEVQRKAEQVARDLHGTKMLNAMRRCTLIVQRAAKINSPANTGRLRASITPEVRVEGVTMTNAVVRGFVGNSVAYAPPVEFGTAPHWPPFGPGSSLSRWSELHGISPFLVARAISRRGTKAVKYLERGLTDNQQKIGNVLEDAVGAIVEE